jgi:hypothetical protein
LYENGSEQDWLKEEYRFLMQQVIHGWEKQSQAFLYGLLAAGALLGFGAATYANLPSLVFLLPVIILLPVALITTSLRNAIDRIGAYVRVRVPASEANLRYESCIHRFRWPCGTGSYLPIFRLMVYTNVSLSLACIGVTLYLPFLAGQGPSVGAIALCLVAFLATVGVLVYLALSDRTCNPQQLEKAWRNVLNPD